MALFVNSTFTGANGTLIWGGFTGSLGETYSKPAFQTNNTSPQIQSNKAVSVNGNTYTPFYATCSRTHTTADYSATARIVLDNIYGGAGTGIRFHATGGFFARIRQNGSATQATIRAESIDSNGTNNSISETSAFTVSSADSYLLTAQGVSAQMQVSCQRVSDGYWVTGAGAWQATQVNCLTVTAGNSVIGAPGLVFFGTTGPAGIATFTADDGAPGGPTIGTQPSNQSATTGASFTFSVSATAGGGGTLSYQWQKNTVNISGATSTSYTGTAGTNDVNGDTFRCVVTETGGASPGSVTSSSATLTVTAAAATATTLTGQSGGTVGAASANFTVGANGAITGTITVTPSDGGGGGTFSPTSVNISAGTPTATFTYTPGSVGAKTISISDTGSLTDATPLTYTATLTSGTLTSSPLKNNTGTALATVAFEAYVSNPSTGALVVKKTGLTSNGSGVVSFSDGAVVAATSYRVVWRRTDTGAEGLETLTGT